RPAVGEGGAGRRLLFAAVHDLVPLLHHLLLREIAAVGAVDDLPRRLDAAVVVALAVRVGLQLVAVVVDGARRRVPPVAGGEAGGVAGPRIARRAGEADQHRGASQHDHAAVCGLVGHAGGRGVVDWHGRRG